MARSVIFMDGFDHYDTSYLSSKYNTVAVFNAANVAIQPTNGRDGKGCLFINYLNGNAATVNFPARKEIIINAAVKPTITEIAYAAEWYGLFTILGTTYTHALTVGINNSGNLCIHRASDYSVILASFGVIPFDRWSHLHIKIKLSTTTTSADGFIHCSVNNQQRYENATLNTRWLVELTDFIGVSIGSRYYQWGNTWNRISCLYDDFYLMGTDESLSGSFPKDRTIKYFYPTASGSVNDFVGSDGNSVENHLLVNETTPNITDSISSSVINGTQSFLYDNATNSKEVVAIQGVALAKKSEVGTNGIIAMNGSVELNPYVNMTTAYGIARSINNVNPATGLAWTPAELASLQLGIRVKDNV